MTDRPLAKYEDGRFWLLQAGRYQKSNRFNVVMMREEFLCRPGPDAARYVSELQQALTDYEQANKGQEETA